MTVWIIPTPEQYPRAPISNFHASKLTGAAKLEKTGIALKRHASSAQCLPAEIECRRRLTVRKWYTGTYVGSMQYLKLKDRGSWLENLSDVVVFCLFSSLFFEAFRNRQLGCLPFSQRGVLCDRNCAGSFFFTGKALKSMFHYSCNPSKSSRASPKVFLTLFNGITSREISVLEAWSISSFFFRFKTKWGHIPRCQQTESIFPVMLQEIILLSVWRHYCKGWNSCICHLAVFL